MIIYNVGWLFFCVSRGGGEQFSLFSIAHLLRVIYTEPMKRGFSYVKKMAFSGHRPFYFPWKENESDPACIHLKAALEAEINKAVADGFFYFIVGGADGVDTWAAEIVLEKKKTNPEINLELAKPFADYNKHLQNDYGRRLRAIEEAADRVTVVSDGADEAADYILRDCYMVDASERMIIVYDDDSKGPSGTKDALLYARSSGVEIRQIQWMHL